MNNINEYGNKPGANSIDPLIIIPPTRPPYPPYGPTFPPFGPVCSPYRPCPRPPYRPWAPIGRPIYGPGYRRGYGRRGRGPWY